MITLPSEHYRRAWLRSFWLVISGACGLGVAGLGTWLEPAQRFAAGALVALALALPGLWKPGLIVLPYRIWNKLAREFARAARLWILGICYYIVTLAVGRTGSALQLHYRSGSGSMWVATSSAGANPSTLSAKTTQESSPRSWVSDYCSWAVQSNNSWACCLLPFLALLAQFETDESENEFPENIYTLY